MKLWIRRFDSGEDRPLTGTELLYLSPENDMMALPMTVRKDAIVPGLARKLFKLTDQSLAVSPDGRRFLVTRTVSPMLPVTLILNWKPLE